MNDANEIDGQLHPHYSRRRSADASITELEKATIEYDGTGRSGWKSFMIVASCTLAMMVNTANSTSPSIALPTIEKELDVQQIELVWIVSGYALSSGCLLLVFGRLADLYGRKKTFLIGNAWLFIFTLGCGFAKNPTALNVLRGFQGVGAAATIPASLGILAHAFPPSRARSIAFSCFAAGAPVGGAFGTALGGTLVQVTKQTWRSTFYLSTGLTFVSLVSGALSIDPDEPSNEPDRRVDWPGAALVTVGLVLIVFVLGQGEVAPRQWATSYIIGLLVAGVFLVLMFLLWQHYLETIMDHGIRPRPDRWIPTLPPLMRLTLWSRANGKVAVVFCIAFLNWCSFLAWTYWVMIYYQSYAGFGPVLTMLRLIPMFVTGIICNVVVALVVGRVSLVVLMALGTALTSSASLLFAIIDPDAVYWAYGFPAAITAVVGADFVFAGGTLFIAKVSLPHEQSVAGAVFQCMTQLGTSMGVTISTIVFNRVIQQQANDARVSIAELPKPGQLKGYKAAQWTNFAFGAFATLLALKYLRGVGIVGHHKESPSNSDNDQTTIPVEQQGEHPYLHAEEPAKPPGLDDEKGGKIHTTVVDVHEEFEEPTLREERRSYR